MRNKIRRIFLLLFVGSLFFTLLYSCSRGVDRAVSGAGALEPAGTSLFIVTDIHLLSEKLYDDGPLITRMINDGDGKNTFFVDELLSILDAEVKAEKPAALLVTGDLTFNGEEESHKELAGFFQRIERSGTEVYVLPGNHDLNNPWARRFNGEKASPAETVTPDQFEKIYKAFGYADHLSRDESSLSYMIEPIDGFQVLMLDSNKYEKNVSLGYPEASGSLGAATRVWIRQCAEAATAENKKIIAAMHHSLIEHNPMVSKGYTIDKGEELNVFFSSLGIEVVLTGHIHVQDIIRAEGSEQEIYDIATGAFSVFPHGYGRLDFENENWTYRAVTLDVEGWAEREGARDEKLLNFDTYSKEFFSGLSEKMVRRVLDADEYTEGEIREIADTAALLNLNFFSGTDDGSVGMGENFEPIFSGNSSFLIQYLQSIRADSAPGDRDFTLP